MPELINLSIGSLALTPAFAADVYEYSVETTNNTNTVTATAAEGVEVTILNGETEVTNGTAVTWAAGENILTITLNDNGAENVYTITVTKS